MGRHKSYDYIIIGSGAAGRAAALRCLNETRSVAVIEAHKWGGAEINTRNLPYETALEFSHLYYLARQGVKMGISSGNLRYNYPTVLNYRNRTVRQASNAIKKELTDAGVTCIDGFANFVGKAEVVVNGETITANQILIATGSAFAHPRINGIETVACYTSDNTFTIKYPPKQITIIGAGWSGCMIAQYYAELGSNVTLLEQAPRILPSTDTETSAETAAWLSQDLKVKIIENARVVAVEPGKSSHNAKIIYHTDNSAKSLTVDTLVLATGYQPFTDLGLENAGINYDQNGIMVDKNGRTRNRRIYAAGSVVA